MSYSHQQQQMRSSAAVSNQNQKGLLTSGKVGSPAGTGGPKPTGGGSGAGNHLMLNQYMQNQNQLQSFNHSNNHQYQSQLSTFGGPLMDKSKSNSKKSNAANPQRMPQQNQQNKVHNNTFSNTMFQGNMSSMFAGNPGGGQMANTGTSSYHIQALSDQKKKPGSNKHSTKNSIGSGLAVTTNAGASGQNVMSSQDHKGALRGQSNGGSSSQGVGGSSMVNGMLIPGQSNMNAQMSNLNNNKSNNMPNQFSPISSQKLASKNQSKKLHVALSHQKGQKVKQSKTTSANSPIASGQQLLVCVAGDRSEQDQEGTIDRRQVPSSNYQLTNNYVGSVGHKVQAPQFIAGDNITNSSSMTITATKERGGGPNRGPGQIKQGYHQMHPPTTVQIKSTKLAGSISKTANHSPTASKKLQDFIQHHPSSKGTTQYQHASSNSTSAAGGGNNQNLNLINQLQQNQQSMLHRVSQKQKRNPKYVAQHDSSSEMNVNDGTGAELLTHDEDNDVMPAKGHYKTTASHQRNQTLQQTVQTIVPNDQASSISTKQKNSLTGMPGSKVQQRSRMSHKSGSQGGQSSGAIRTSQRIDSSKNRTNTKAAYNQKRIQNSMQIHSNQMQKNQMNHQSSSSFMNNPSINEESIGVPQISQPTNTQSIRTKNPWLNSEGNENATNLQKLNSTGMASYTINNAGAVVLGSESSTHLNTQAQSKQKGAALIQAPLCIKVKSKTNANPTRKNSPRFSNKFSVSQSGTNPLRESQNSRSIKNMMQITNDQRHQGQNHMDMPDEAGEESEENMEGDMDGNIDHVSQLAGEASISVQKPQRHQAKRNAAAAGGTGLNNYYVVSPGGGSSAGGQQQTNPEQMHQQLGTSANQAIRQSIDKKIQNLQQMKSRVKGNSCKSVYQGLTVPASGAQAPPSQAAQRIQSGTNKNFQNNNRRLNSPASNLNAAANSVNAVAKSHLAQFNKTQYATQTQQKSKFDQQQQIFLNMAVQKKIGGIASGKQRRENRNLLMKNQQNQMHDNSNSVVGSMGSMGSLGPLVGIQDASGIGGGQAPGLVGDMPEAGYNTMKYPISNESSKSNKANDQKLQQMHLSQLQQMHLNNFNPMVYPNGDGLKQSQQQQSHQNQQNHLMNSVGGYNFQSMTMSGLSSQINPTTSGGAAAGEMASTQANFVHQQSKSSGPQQRQKKNASQNHHNQKSFMPKANAAQQVDHQASTGGGNQSTTYYEQNRQSQQTKGNMIVQRKANPISKTTANVSKNPSIERGNKNTSMGPVGGTFASGLMPINVSGGKSMQGVGASNNFKMSSQQYKHGGKNFAQTSKVSYNNSPNNRNKGGSLGVVANIVTNQGPHVGPAGQQIGAHQNQANKRQQQLRQPIGQPMGDIPLLSKEQISMQNNFSNQNDNGQMSKHQFAQSTLAGSDPLQGGYQTQQSQHLSKGAAHPQNQSPGGNAGNPPSLASSKKELTPNLNQIDGSSPNTGASQRGKLKLKVMSQTNSPKEKFENSQGDAIMGLNQQYGSTNHNRGQASYNNKKGKLGGPNIGNSQGGRSGRGLVSTGSGSGPSGPSTAAAKQHPHTTSNSQNAKNKPQPDGNAGGQQYLYQYFKQNKKSNFIQIQKYGGFSKYAQIDSPKDSSIERARQNDMIQQEQQVTQMNQQLQNVITIDNQHENDHEPNTNTQKAMRADKTISQGQFSQSQNQLLIHDANRSSQGDPAIPGKSPFQVNNTNQQCIIQNIESSDVSQLSPRSKEVYLIKQLIVDCFEKYGKPPKTQLELYKIGKMLGKGAFGKVNLGLHRLTRKLVAIKSINMDFMKEESQKKKIMNEINILKSLRHPNNIKILETFQTDKHHMIVMELCPGGDLLNYVRKRRKLTEKYAKFVFKQIMEGIAYLHENKVSHRDIKLDNILLDGHGNIKIGDFGVSRKIEENELLFEQCGTPAYIAPEIVKDMGYKGFPVDIWSAGICLFAMLYGNVPFKANQIGDLNTVEQLNQEIEYKDTVSKDAIELMKTMLQKVPRQRATAQDVLQHAWLNDDIDEHIDIFDEQELELIRKEFTYILQKKKLREFKEQKERLIDSANADLPYHQATRRDDDLNTEFTECSIQTHQNSLLKNDSSRSVILCPFNTQTGDKTADKIIAQAEGLMEDKDLMMRFHPRVRELDRNYEKLNNQDFDNGVYHKYAYKQKVNQKKDDKAEAGGIKEENIQQSDVQMNNLVADNSKNENGATNAQTARKRRREKADINYHNYYIKINDNIIHDTSRLGFPVQYIQKCLRENANNHCTTTYYLLCMDQNF